MNASSSVCSIYLLCLLLPGKFGFFRVLEALKSSLSCNLNLLQLPCRNQKKYLNCNNDRLKGRFGNDLLLGGFGDDTLKGGFGNDLLNASVGDDKLNGGFGNDKLNGSIGNDKLNGSMGDDLLNGGIGNDKLNGGLGKDTYIFGSDILDGQRDVDTINHFQKDDTLDFTGYLNVGGTVEFTRVSQNMLRVDLINLSNEVEDVVNIFGSETSLLL